jgi:CRISPR-associated protein Csc2
VRNELIGIVFADGEIVSNLRWTQKIYDLMSNAGQMQPPDPLNEDEVLDAATQAIRELMAQECIPHTDFVAESLQPLLGEVKSITSDESQLTAMLTQANTESSAYAKKYIFKSSEKGKKSSKKVAAATE